MCTYVCTHVYVQHNRKNRKHRREQNIVHALITFTCIHFWFWSIYPGIHWVYHRDHCWTKSKEIRSQHHHCRCTGTGTRIFKVHVVYITCTYVYTPPRYNNNRAITVPPLPTKNHPTYLLILDTKSNHPRPNGVGCRPRVFSRTAPF